jgi:hypothetical protein
VSSLGGVKRRFITPLLDAVTFAHDCGNRFNRSRSCLSWEAARWRDPTDDLNEVAPVEKLVEAGLLPAAQIDDRVAITKATEQLLEIFVPEKGAVGGIDKKVDSGL